MEYVFGWWYFISPWSIYIMDCTPTKEVYYYYIVLYIISKFLLIFGILVIWLKNRLTHFMSWIMFVIFVYTVHERKKAILFLKKSVVRYESVKRNFLTFQTGIIYGSLKFQYCARFQDLRRLLPHCLNNGGNKILWNTGQNLPYYMAESPSVD